MNTLTWLRQLHMKPTITLGIKRLTSDTLERWLLKSHSTVGCKRPQCSAQSGSVFISACLCSCHCKALLLFQSCSRMLMITTQRWCSQFKDTALPFHPAINEKSKTSAGYPACDRKPKNCGLPHSGLKKRLKFKQRLITEGQRLFFFFF